MIIRILNGTSVTALAINHRIDATIDNLAWDTWGLCKDATVIGVGSEADARDALSWVGYPILIMDEGQRDIWWGYIDTVESTVGALTRKRSLNTLVNRYQALYTEPTISGRGETFTSAWIQDDRSIARYGTHEQRISLQGVTTVQATAGVNTRLAMTKDVTQELAIGSVTSGKQPTVRLLCKGWLETLKWQYYTQTSGYTAHNVNGDKVHKLGLGLTDTTIGFYRGKKTIHDLTGRLGVFKAADSIQVTGSTSNNATYTVAQSTSREPFTITSIGIAFRTFTGKSRIKDVAYGLGVFTVGSSVTVTGSASNNGTYVIKGAASDGGYLEFDTVLIAETSGASITLTSGVTIYTAMTISVTSGAEWQVTDLIGKTLTELNAGDMIKITGSAANNGLFFVTSAASDGTYAEVDRVVTTAVAGASITIARGTQITVNETLTSEYAAASVTVQFNGSSIGQVVTLVAGSWTIDTIRWRIRKVGNPIDRLMSVIQTTAAGIPTGALDTAYVDGIGLSINTDWIPFDFTNTVVLSNLLPRCITLRREVLATLSVTDYYEVSIDTVATYTGGAMARFAGTWTVRTPAADIPFIILGAWETSYHASQLILSAAQFITGIDIKTVSGVFANQYQDGKQTAYDVLEKMMALGHSSNRRMRVTITPERVLRLDVESISPEQGLRSYGILDNGTMVDQSGEMIPFGQYPVGVWADTRNSTFDDDPIFIERVSWKPGSMPRIEVRNQKAALTRGVQQG